MDKKGELTSSQIVMIVLAIAGFAFVVLFITGIFELHQETTEKELCKLSILERATIPLVGDRTVPLRCSPEKVCITSKKNGKCSQFIGEENIRTVKLNLNKKEESIKIIERESANAMYDCWDMSGKGRLDIFDSKFTDFEEVKPMCLICSRIAVAEDVDKDIMNGVDLANYISREKVPGSTLTYLQTFTDGGVRGYAGADRTEKETFSVESSNQLAMIFMQIKTEKSATDAFGDTALLGAGILIGGGVLTTSGRFITKLALGASATWTAIIAAAAIGGAATFAAVQTGKNRDVSAMYCGEFETNNEKARAGCSIVKQMKWDANLINNLCTGGIAGEF